MDRLSVLGGFRGSGPGRARALAASALAAGLLSALPASAIDHQATGSLYDQRENSSRHTLKVRSKDPTVSLPTSDPTSSGGTLLVELTYGVNTGSESINLPASRWKVSGSSVKFTSESPRVRVTIKSGKIRLAADVPNLTLANAPHNAASVVIVAGSDRYCLGFGSVPAVFNNTTRLSFKQQASAGQCSVISASTTTTSSTSSTSSSTIPSCGDGAVQSGNGEQCDDANVVPCDGCTNCKFDVCGDNNLCANQGEQCDDGNLAPGDGCNASCETEGQTCLGPITGNRVAVVSINTALSLAGVQVQLEYPQILTSIPGSGTSSLVQSRIQGFATPPQGSTLTQVGNDDNLAMTILVTAPVTPGNEFITSGALLAINFDECVDASHNICNRNQTVIDCCNNPNDPNQFSGTCNAYKPSPISCTSDSQCPERLNTSCTGVQTPYLCCTGAGTGTCSNDGCTGAGTPYNCCTGVNAGNCQAANITSQCVGSGNPFPCCTGAGAGTGSNCVNTTAGNGGINCLAAGNPLSCCTGLNTGPTCDITPLTDQLVGIASTCATICPGNPPVCAVNEVVVPTIHNNPETFIGPCAGPVCSNNATRACDLISPECISAGMADLGSGPVAQACCTGAGTGDCDCVSPGTCTGTQQTGACPGDNQCQPQTGPTGVTQCQIIDPVNALGEVIDNSRCTGSGTPLTCCTGAGTGTCTVTCSVTIL
jgi:cysteine-rich repeat protein